MTVEINLVYVIYVLAALLIIAVGFAINLMVKIRKNEKNMRFYSSQYSQLENQYNSAQLENLKSKLSPHLFKNILNSIQSQTYQTYHMIDNLANVLDFILYESQKKFVTPEEEIAFALNLIEINKIKLSPLFQLKVQSKIHPNEPLSSQQLLAPLISIDIIENAFKHADLQSPDAFISVAFEVKDGYFKLTASNKISKRNFIKKDKSGIGNETLEQRLKIIYKDNFKLERYVEGDVYMAYLKINLLEHKAQMLALRR